MLDMLEAAIAMIKVLHLELLTPKGESTLQGGVIDLIAHDHGGVFKAEEEEKLISLIRGRKYEEALKEAQRIEKEIWEKYY